MKKLASVYLSKVIKILFLLTTILLFLWILGRVFIADYFSVNTYSMYPAIKPNSTIVVNKLIFGARIYKKIDFESEELNSFRVKGLRKLRVNDIIVFNYPFDENITRIRFKINHVYVKRVAGIPGDTVSIASGFYKNSNYSEIIGDSDNQSIFSSKWKDSLSHQKNDVTFPYNKEIYDWNGINFGPFYVPKKGDRIELNLDNYILYKMIIECETGENFNIDNNDLYLGKNAIIEYVFSKNYYFVAGDNVSNSLDSRHFGLIPEEFIIGVVKWIH